MKYLIFFGLVSLLLSTSMDPLQFIETAKKTPVVNRSYFYTDIGMGPIPYPFPALEFGFNAQYAHIGINFSMLSATVFYFNSLGAKTSVKLYPWPCRETQIYVALGTEALKTFHGLKKKHFSWGELYVCPQIAFGMEYLNEERSLRFFELQMISPLYKTIRFSHTPKKAGSKPLVLLKYGIGF